MSPTRPLLVVEDDDTLRQLLADQLVSNELFHVSEAANLGKASQHLESPDTRCDAIILDISLPDGADEAAPIPGQQT